MSKPFPSSSAKQLVDKTKMIIKRLEEVEKLPQSFDDLIEQSANDLAKEEYDDILDNTYIEEVLQEMKGVRIKPLREKGYNTLYDLSCATINQIASVKGISRDSAEEINNIVQRQIQSIRQELKIHLNMDNRTPVAGRLVHIVDSKIHSLILRKKTRLFLTTHKLELDEAVKELQPGTGFFSWIFASPEKRQKTISAYSFLDSFYKSDNGLEAQSLINEVDSIKQLDLSQAWMDFSKNSIRFFNILEEIVPELLGNSDSYYGLPEELINEIQNQPLFLNGLRCELRRYQEWGVKYILHQNNVLLGDEMGLGKTIQAIASMVSLKNNGAIYFVVVCPASVLSNWCREIKEKSNLAVYKVHGQGKITTLNSWANNGGVAVTTYETTSYFQFEQNSRFSLLVVDEAHYVKNPHAKRTGNIKALCEHAERLLFMTGTALENKASEMIELISILQPKIANRIKNLALYATALEFRKMISQVYCRRKREDVLTELPELIENEEWCTLLPSERKEYERALVSENFMEIRRVSWNIDNLSYSSKAKRLVEIIDEAESDGRKIIIFSFFLETIRKLRDFLGNRCMQPITGSVTPAKRQEIIDDFDHAPAGSVLCAQIQTGGTGLNIQCASVIIICEPQLKPSTENQAISRSYRMGQTRTVLVYKLYCEDTIDERICEILEKKDAIFDTFADKSESGQMKIEIDDQTLRSIIREEQKKLVIKSTI